MTAMSAGRRDDRAGTGQDEEMHLPAGEQRPTDALPGHGQAAAHLVVAPDWRITDADPTAEALLGEAGSSLIGRSLWHVVRDAEELEIALALPGAMRDRTVADVEEFVPLLGMWVHWRIVPADSGGLVLSLSDVTASRMNDPRAVSALSRLGLLARVSESLASTEDPDEAVGRLARLVVPYLGDWAFVTVIDDDGHMRDLGLAHRDPRRFDDLAAYSARHLEEMTETAAVWRALHGTTHVVVPRLSDQILANFIPDPRAAGLTRRLDPHGVAAFPLVARGRTFGALTVVTTSPRGPHTAQEIATGLEVARRAAPVLEAARAAQRARTLAESLQRSVLTVSSRAPHLQTAVRYLPASNERQVGGDWYDAFDRLDGSTVITIGDVMGHDIAAAAAMSQLRTLMRGMAWSSAGTPAEVLSATDRASAGLRTSTFATAFTAHLGAPDADGAVPVTWSSAGHPPQLVLRRSGAVERLGDGSPGPPLGVSVEVERHDATTVLHPGEMLFLYTDGLIERRTQDIDAGLAQLEESLDGLHRADLDLVLDAAVLRVVPDTVADDVALLVARVRSPEQDTNDAGVAPDTSEVVTIRLPSDPIAAALGRDHVRRHGAHLPADRVADAELIVTELLGNAIRHGQSPVTLDLQTTRHGLRVAVADSGPGRPVVRITRPDDTATGGRGLLITDALASRWGVGPNIHGPGKSVWFVMEAGG